MFMMAFASSHHTKVPQRDPFDEKPVSGTETDIDELITSHMDLVRQIAWHMHGRVHSL